MMSSVKVVVLDVDDTLYLERSYVRSGFEAVSRWAEERFRLQEFSERCQAVFDQGGRGDIFQRVLDAAGASYEESTIQEMVDCYREHEPRIELLPDARLMLEELQGRVFFAVISDGPRIAQEKKVRALGLDGWVDTVLLTDRWGRDAWKPNPRAFLEIERVFDAHQGDCAYVADNPHKDFIAPRALGWWTVRVRRPSGLHATTESPSEGRPDHEVPDLTYLHTLLSP
jgi:putative hydrolase of the HAD superfamily